MKVKMEPTRKGFGKSLADNGGDERIVCLGLDISGSITIADFYAGKPERANRWISMGIAEQSATAAAAGLARKASCRCLAPMPRFRQRAISISFASPSATETSTFWLPERTPASRRPRRRHAPGARRPVCHAGHAQYDGRGSLRRH